MLATISILILHCLLLEIDQQANPSILICIIGLSLFLVNNAESHRIIIS
jgi:hypothetical protein